MPCVGAYLRLSAPICASLRQSASAPQRSVALKPTVLLRAGFVCCPQLDVDMNKKVSNHEMKRFR